VRNTSAPIAPRPHKCRSHIKNRTIKVSMKLKN
jgi:hypothetical protein